MKRNEKAQLQIRTLTRRQAKHEIESKKIQKEFDISMQQQSLRTKFQLKTNLEN